MLVFEIEWIKYDHGWTTFNGFSYHPTLQTARDHIRNYWNELLDEPESPEIYTSPGLPSPVKVSTNSYKKISDSGVVFSGVSLAI